jgi:hypothetical protein
MRNLVTALTLLAFTFASDKSYGAGFMDYFSGCLISMGAGIAGAAAANSNLSGAEDAQFDTGGYAVSGVLSCLVGVAYVGVVSSNAEFAAEYDIRAENERLSYQMKRLSKERCLLNATCRPGGRAIIVDGPTEIRKQGDKVFETTTSTIEPLE